MKIAIPTLKSGHDKVTNGFFALESSPGEVRIAMLALNSSIENEKIAILTLISRLDEVSLGFFHLGLRPRGGIRIAIRTLKLDRTR